MSSSTLATSTTEIPRQRTVHAEVEQTLVERHGQDGGTPVLGEQLALAVLRILQKLFRQE